jgi:hypothetical protein
MINKIKEALGMKTKQDDLTKILEEIAVSGPVSAKFNIETATAKVDIAFTISVNQK